MVFSSFFVSRMQMSLTKMPEYRKRNRLNFDMNDLISGRNKSGQNVFVDLAFQ